MSRKFVATVLLATAVVFTFTSVSPAADQIERWIKNALKYYQEGKYQKAKTELEFAVGQLRRKKAEALADALPKAVPGWKEQSRRRRYQTSSVIGGMVSAEKYYNQDGGRGQVKIQVLTDSPMLQSMAMMLSNPMMMQSSGHQIVEVKGQRGLLKQNSDRRAELLLLLEGKVLVTITASNVDDPGKVCQLFADKLDFAALQQFGKK